MPIYVPRPLWEALLAILSHFRVISPRQERPQHDGFSPDQSGKAKPSSFVKLSFPLNFVTAPLIADLFLLAILAIGRQEVHDGTIGADGISPIDIMLFFLSLAYIAISIDASGLIRYLAFHVLNWGGDNGYRLYFYLYTFFFCVASFIGNDPIILSGTAFIAYMTRVSRNIRHPRAWIHMQFTVANMGSAILVSSNPTNLVLAGAFDIKFIHYTANMVVPVIVTAIVLFPFLLYIIFRDENLIPASIEIHELPVELRKENKKALNPNIPHVRANLESTNNDPGTDEQTQLLSLEEIMNPFVDQFGAAFGAIIMATTLITLLALNAAGTIHEVFWVTLPAAFVMLCWDLAFGWFHRQETRKIAKDGRRTLELAQAKRAIEMEAGRGSPEPEQGSSTAVIEPASTPMVSPEAQPSSRSDTIAHTAHADGRCSQAIDDTDVRPPTFGGYSLRTTSDVVNEKGEGGPVVASLPFDSPASYPPQKLTSPTCEEEIDEKKGDVNTKKLATLVSLVVEVYVWLQETFPTATTVVAHLPFALVPFAFSMFVLVQGLVTKGWVPVFAYGWDHWVNKTGTLGSIGGMGFLSAVLCNVSLYAFKSAVKLHQLTIPAND